MPRKGKRISSHGVRVKAALDRRWRTAAEIAERSSVAYRTARAHLSALVGSGYAEEQMTFPALTYRRAKR